MVFPKALDLDRPKRPRTTFSEAQLGVLEAEFARSHYLVGKDRARLATELGLSETQVQHRALSHWGDPAWRWACPDQSLVPKPPHQVQAGGQGGGAGLR